MIKRVLSFNRSAKGGRPPRAAARDATTTEPTDARAETPASASPAPSSPAPTRLVSAAKGIRRNLSFARRGAPTKEKPAAAAKSPEGADAASAPAAAARRAAATPGASPGGVVASQIRRTFSWQRGQKKQAGAAKGSAARGVGLERAAPTLMQHLAPETLALLAQTCTALRAIAATLAARPHPPPPHPAHAGHTHEGGEGGVGKENQDAYFVITPSPELAVYAVLDGHGRRYGRLASRVAAERMRLLLSGLHRWVVDQPEEALRFAFAEGHSAIRQAICRKDPTARLVQGRDGAGKGAYLLHWISDDEVRTLRFT